MKRRPEFERMMDDARRGKVRAVFIWAIDRFHRSRAEGARAIEQLDHWRVPVASVREAWLDTGGPLRAVLIQILLWVAEGERGRLIERTRAGLDRARRQGKRLGRPPVDSVMLAAGARFVGDGKSIRQAAKLAGISEATLRRHLAAVDAPALAA